MKSVFVAAAIALLAVSPGASQAQTSGPLAINVMSTAAFIDNATWDHMFAVQSSRLAVEKSEDPKIREFAQMMIREHTREIARLAKAVSTENAAISPPSRIDREDALVLDKLLLMAPGPEFDRLYTSLQIDRYERSLQLHRAYSVTGENADLKQVAASAATRARERLSRASLLTAPVPMTGERLASGAR